MANFKKNGKKIRTTSEHYTQKIMKILRTANSQILMVLIKKECIPWNWH